MDDWENEQIPPLLLKEQPKSKWDDEDDDENDVKESWEDEDEPAPAPKEKPATEKSSKKAGNNAADSKGKAVEVKASESLDPVAEKLRQQRLVEEADLKSTKDLFGKRGDEKTIDNFIPKSQNDFDEYAELIFHKIHPFEKSYYYIGLLKEVMRQSLTSLKAADAKELASFLTAIANEKLKAEKEANAGKKKSGSKKKQLHIEKADDDLIIDAYDPVDDYDFM